MIYWQKKPAKLILIIAAVLLFANAYSQRNEKDSLLNLLRTSKEDTNKVLQLIQLANAYTIDKEFEESEKRLYEAKVLTNALGYQFGIALNYRGYARLTRAKNELDKAADYFVKAATSFEKQKYINLSAEMYGVVGNVYYEKSLFDKSIENFLKALKLYEKLGKKKAIAGYSGNVGAIYQKMGESKKSITYYEKALAINTEINSKQGIAIDYVSIANAYSVLKDDDKALIYHFKGLKINEELGDSSYISNNLTNIAVSYENKEDYKKAIEFMERAIAMTSKDDINQHITNFLALGKLHIKTRQYKKAEKYLLQSEELLKQYNSLDWKNKAYQFLSTVYDSLGDYKRSLRYYRQHVYLRDSIYSDQNRRSILENQLQFEYEKKTAADSVRVEGEKKIVATQLKEERTQRFALYGGLALIAIFAGFMFNRFRITNRQKNIIELKEKETQQQKYIIEEKHKAITDSINYAERIQRSFLATKELLDANLKEYFILFKPKDIVSGDFYWAGKLSNGNFALITADSTGHGVPGAIMSLLNITSVELAIKDGYKEPADILNQTRATIIERLRRDGSAEGGKDGMDASLTVYDFKNKKLIIAAANNPVWIVRGKETIEIVADKMPVGKHDKDAVSFTQQEIVLQSGDIVYTLTDGFADQFGGKNGKKFLSKNLRELLATNAHLAMDQQREILESTFKNWIRDMEQVDDVVVIGVRIS